MTTETQTTQTKPRLYTIREGRRWYVRKVSDDAVAAGPFRTGKEATAARHNLVNADTIELLGNIERKRAAWWLDELLER